MKKNGLCLLLFCGLFLAGCGQKNDTTTNKAVLPSFGPVISGTTKVPEATTEAPSSSEPLTTKAPETTTKAPAATSETPAVTTTAPETTAVKPGEFKLPDPAELLPVPSEIGRSSLSDGGWYPGKFVRDLTTGTVKCEWDRTAALQAMLEKYGAIYRKNKDKKVMYLTFDCGGTTTTQDVENLLKTLREKNVKAIFFIPGDFICSNLNRPGESIIPERAAVLRKILEEGHLLGSHTYTHPTMPDLSDEDFISQLNTQQLRINEALGFDYQLSYYRPPTGAISERDLYLAQKMGYHVVLWAYAYSDYNRNNQMEVSQALEKAKVGLHDGCVYLLHALSTTNQSLLGDLIDYAKAQGYEIRRIDQ